MRNSVLTDRKQPFLKLSHAQCSTCPDSSNCARLLEDKWRQAYHAVFRFGMRSRYYYIRTYLILAFLLHRSTTTVYGLPLPEDVGGCQSTSVADTVELSDYGKGFCRHL
jgi:hypothetical protein